MSQRKSVSIKFSFSVCFVWLIDVHVQKLTLILKQTCTRSICALIQLLSEAVQSLKNCNKHVPRLVNCRRKVGIFFYLKLCRLLKITLLKNNVLAYSYFQSSRIFLLEPQTKMSVHIEEVPKDLEEQVEELHAQVVIGVGD